MMVAPAAASRRARNSWFGSAQAVPSVPQCMNTITTPAIFLAARTAARVRLRLTAFASPGRDLVATHDVASSATWDTPRKANVTPLIVTT